MEIEFVKYIEFNAEIVFFI